MQKMLSYVRRAVDHYHMIDEGDRIAVGVSGGKDSLALLVALSQLSRFYPHHFTVVAITLEMGYDEMDFSPVQTLCAKLGVEYIRVPTQIGPIVFDIRHEENPCSLCAKLRRGALHDAARKAGCSKVALGHHFDDVVETYMLSLFYEGRISCFSPFLVLPSRSAIHTESSFSSMTSRIYFERRAELVSISLTVISLSMTKQESNLTKSVTQSLIRRLLPIAARVYLLTC